MEKFYWDFIPSQVKTFQCCGGAWAFIIAFGLLYNMTKCRFSGDNLAIVNVSMNPRDTQQHRVWSVIDLQRRTVLCTKEACWHKHRENVKSVKRTKLQFKAIKPFIALLALHIFYIYVAWNWYRVAQLLAVPKCRLKKMLIKLDEIMWTVD